MLKPLMSSVLLAATLGIVGCNTASNVQQQQSSTLLQNKEWTLTHIGSTEIKDDATSSTPKLKFDQATQRLSGTDGCNQLMAGYKIEGAQLNLTQFASTKMMCMGKMQQADQFNQALAKVTAYQSYGHQLKLLDRFGNNVLKFSNTVITQP